MIDISFAKTISTTSSVKIIGLLEGTKTLPASLSKDEKARATIALKQAGFTGKANTFVTVLGGAPKLIIVGFGKEPAILDFQKSGGSIVPHISKDETATIVIEPLKGVALKPDQIAAEMAYGIQLAAYRFDKYKTKKDEETQPKLKKITFVLEGSAAAAKAYQHAGALATAVTHARDLCNEPGNKLTPKLFAADIQKLTKIGVEVEILDVKMLKEKGFNLLLAVAQGSVNEPRVAIFKWIGKPIKKTIDLGLVGKGVTFDSGGLSLKPFASMLDMHHDMNGAAAVVTTLESLALQSAPVNVIGIVGLVENMPSGTATRPQDIVTSMSGQTVEILNTDAEGRLVLADCLWYLQDHYGVTKIIDLATLTGAVMMALGSQYAGLFTNDEKLATDLIAAGQTSDEKLWRLPMGEAYNKKIDSTVADMKNIGGPLAGGSTAACFLERFIKPETTWAHLDIAGVDKEDSGTALCPKGATGFGTRLLNAFIK